MKFPCRQCLVKTCCGEYCNKLISNGRTVALYLMLYNTCPDCGNPSIETSRDNQLKVCQECTKVFTKRVRREIDERLFYGPSSSTSSSQSFGTGPLIIKSTSMNPGIYQFEELHLITNVSKYKPVTFYPPLGGKTKDKSPQKTKGKKFIEFERITAKYCQTIIEKLDILNKSELNIPEKVLEDGLKAVPQWIGKHRDLFIKDPRDEGYDDDYGFDLDITI